MKVRFEIKFILLYLLLGFIWILFSDKALLLFFNDTDTITTIQTYKGWFYVTVTGVLFYVIIRNHIKKIVHAEKRAIQSDNLKSLFLQNISHEIRTPMNGVLGFANLLKSNKDADASQKELYVDIILNSSRRLLGIVNDILDISLLESGSGEIFMEQVRVKESISNVLNIYKSSLHSEVTMEFRNIETTKEIVINTDKAKFQQILSNVISNAVKFTKKGEILVAFDITKKEIILRISDTGIGIEKEKIDKIFDRFSQAELEISRNYGGTGLGLAICKGNVQLLNGGSSIN